MPSEGLFHVSSGLSSVMPHRYFVAVINVCSKGLVRETDRKLTVEVEVDAAEIDTHSHQFRKAIEDASEPYTARHFDNRTEMLSGFELTPINKAFKKFEEPVETSLPGVRIWRVMPQETLSVD